MVSNIERDRTVIPLTTPKLLVILWPTMSNVVDVLM
jgi:hypothetical protein